MHAVQGRYVAGGIYEVLPVTESIRKLTRNAMELLQDVTKRNHAGRTTVKELMDRKTTSREVLGGGERAARPNLIPNAIPC
jgi:hypothetical protein